MATLATQATERQHNFILSLLATRDMSGITNPKYQARILEILDGTGEPLTMMGASALIDGLLTLPKLPAPELVEVPAGFYALDVDGDLRFYRVDRPTEGRWEGYTFVKMLAGEEEIRLRRDQSAAILEKIALDPREAAIRYGHEIGKCSICNRRLTNEASRAAGIGPVCASKLGW